MPGVDEVLHNLRDHIVTLRDILDRNQATGDARARLLAHMLREEEDNQRRIAAALPSAGPEQKRALEVALDHSRFFCDIVRGKEIAPELAKSLLEHFQEEHDQGLAAPLASPPAKPPAPPRPGWTVGSLMGGTKP